MAGDWPTATVAELQRDRILLVEDGNHGEYRPRPDEFGDGGVAFIRAADMDAGRVLFESASRINERARQRITKGIGAPGDVLLSHKGTVGKIALVPDDAPPFVCSPQTTFWRTLDLDRLDRRYLYAFMRSRGFHEQLATRAGETDMAPYVSLTSQRALSVTVPPIGIQRAVAHILGTLDDKIELNLRMNETLEAMARALYQSWFVDFDPVRAKVEGRDSGLPSDLADRFPSSFLASELGEVPKGWRIETLSEVCDKPQYGYTASASDEQIGPRFLRITDINKRDWIEWENVPFCAIETNQLIKYALKPGDIVIARMADPGHGALIEEAVDAVFASYLIRFRPRQTELGRFLQYWLRSESYWHSVRSRQSGTTRANLNAQVLGGFPLVVPENAIQQVFSQFVGALRDRVIANARESRTLASLRDTLLPKLISGELRVKCVEKLAGEAA